MTITVSNVNEAPRFTVGPTRDKQEEKEDTDTSTTDVIDIPTLSYRVTDVDADDDIEWSLMGDDKDAFEITVDSANTNGTTFAADLMFETTPNYEAPTDTNMDNMYMVTVVATDAKDLTAMRHVVITVTNENDDGKITFSSVQPKVGIPFMATLTDPDGVVMESVKWQWYNDNPDSNDDGDVDDQDTNAAPIAKAKSDTYTPKIADLDADGAESGTAAVSLYVRATYTDSKGSTSAVGMADNLVVVNQENQPPEFKLNDKVITSTTRMVVENTEANSEDDAARASNVEADDIMAPGDDRTMDAVMATDMSGTTPDTLTYTLGGRDAALFRVRSDSGIIEVGADTKLDYEKKKSYMVMVTATDPSLRSATIDVTINVTDVNEPPDIAGEDDITKEFRENSTSTIETFRATDPERRPVYWSLKADDTTYPDDDFFTISSSGALSFNEGRDFENPLGGDDSNTYKVIVIASDDVPGAGITTARADIQAADPIIMSERKFTVLVTNVAERGSVTVDRRYPRVAVPVLATLMDGDATTDDISTATWQWYKGSTELSGNGAGTATYTPQPDDATTLRVKATYEAKGANRTASTTVSVRPVPDETNEQPEFPPGNDARTVQENQANTNVGAPITATDSNSADRGRLTYSLPDSETNFSINATSGQLKTTAGLNHESNDSHDVVVTVTDPATITSSVTVTVTVTVEDVNEAPMFRATATDLTSGPTRVLDWRENTTPITTHVATYPAFDPDEGAELVWSLTGPDANDFEISNETATLGYLTFKESPDYEMPAASNNLYRVTVEVSDGKLKATRPMTVMVTDVEENGIVMLSSVQPKVAIELTASLKDSDSGVENVTWQWERDGKDTPSAVCSGVDGVDAGDWVEIDGAESATYTPVTSPITDVDKCLRAIAKYTDRRGDGKTSTMGVSDNRVIVNTDNRAPEFDDDDSYTRKINENVEPDTAEGINPANVGLVVMADDPNSDALTYSLSGDDMGSFMIDPLSGQISAKMKLNYEAKNTYMVTVTATDPNGLSDSVDVTIKVTDLDEKPKITVGGLAISAGPTNPDHTENSTASVGTYTVVGAMKDSAMWTLTGNDASHFMVQPATGMSVMLMFKTAPDHEMPGDANMDNYYMVTLNAVDSEGNVATPKAVKVRVTNMDEDGTVTLSSTTPSVGTEITASLTDLDSPDGVTGATWQWARSDASDGAFTDISGAMSASYTPVDPDDTGKYLRAMASYTDGEGTGKEKMAVSDNMVIMASTNTAPEFSAETAERMVAENTAAGEPVGAPVTAMDADAGDTLTYSLSGTDAASFDIDGGTGQIKVGATTMLDYEATQSTYMVTVTATDAAGATDSIDVTVTVTDVDEGMPMDLLTRYDENKNNVIDLPEVFRAIDDYFDYDDRLTLDEVYEVVDLYFES